MTRSYLAATTLVAALGLFFFAAFPQRSSASLQGEAAAKRAQLQAARQQVGVLGSEVASLGRRLGRLSGQVAALQARETMLQNKLRIAQARLDRERKNYLRLKRALRRDLIVLAGRVRAMYETNDPDLLGVVLRASGWRDLITRVEFMQKIGRHDRALVRRVKRLKWRSAKKKKLLSVLANQIRAEHAELRETRISLEAQASRLESVQAARRAQLARVEREGISLQGEVSKLESAIAAQARAASAYSAPGAGGGTYGDSGAVGAAPVGGGGGSAGAGTYGVSGPIVGGFGEARPGHTHAGLDISAPGGTPIRAPEGGTVEYAGTMGGYGQYTCVKTGANSECFAHQSQIKVKVGQKVSKGQTIGNVGCTGSCQGNHLHFEVRKGGPNGQPVDPRGKN